MLDSITIKNFKAIQSENGLTLNNLTNVNYLVGKNGCGKSSVLEALWIKLLVPKDIKEFDEMYIRSKHWRAKAKEFPYQIPKQDFDDLNKDSDSRNYFLYKTENSKITINFNNNFNLIKERYKNDNNFNFSEMVRFIDKDYWSTNSFVELEFTAEWQDRIKRLSEVLDIEFIDDVKNSLQLLKQYNLFKSKVGISDTVYKRREDKEMYEPFELAGGLINFIPLILNIVDQTITYKDRNFGSHLIFIEEPEMYLHPEYQKKIPKILEAINIKCPNTQFIISTHSPFIVSAAAEFYDSQKVYLIKDGQTVDLEGNLGKGSDGYSGGECILTANEMLGADVDSLSSAVVFCEKTLSIILDDVVKRNKSKRNFTFSSMGGGGDSSIYNSLVKAYRFNINNLSIYAIIDKDENTIKQIEKDRSCVIKNTLPVEQKKDCNAKSMASTSIFVSEYYELEDFFDIDKVNEFLVSKNYPIWNKANEKYFAKEYCKNNFPKDFESGELKLELAEYMKQFINKNDIKIFCSELYELVFN